MILITHRLTVRRFIILLLPFLISVLLFGVFTKGHAQTSFTCTTVTEISQAECEVLLALAQSTNGAEWATRAGWFVDNRPCSWFGLSCSGQQLLKISLNNRGLTGVLPAAIGKLSYLQILDLSNNRLQGAIPATLGALPLQELDLSQNAFTGALPAELGNATTLQGLNLRDNALLTGPLPQTFTHLTQLQTLVFDRTTLCEPTDQRWQSWRAGVKQVQPSGLRCVAESEQLLTIHLLVFDNHAADIDINLTPYYRAVFTGIVQATANAPQKTAALVVDLDGVGDTHVVIIRNGAVERVLGSSTLNERLAQTFAGWTLSPGPEPFLPDANGVLATPARFEYNMTDAATLGGVLRWLFTTYGQQAPRTFLSYVGHGASVVPDVDVASALGVAYCDSNPDAPAPPPTTGIISLPSRRGAHPAFTDCHGSFDAGAGQYRPALLAPRSLARALQTAFVNSPIQQIDLLDLFHCFALSLETLAELTPNGVPLAGMVIGSPNYAFFAAEMAGAAVAEDKPTLTIQERAQAILTRYESVLRAGLAAPEESAAYPRLVVAVEASKIPPLIAQWNQVVTPLLMAWQEPATRPAVQQTLSAAYQAAGKYDTTYCNIDPAAQSWELKTPDALTDLGDFARRLGEQSSDAAVQNAVQALLTTLQDAIRDRRIGENGIPKGLHPTAAVAWDWNGYSGISLYSDFARMTLPAIGESRSWQAYWYNNAQQAYNFTAQSSWDDLLNLFWLADDPNGQVLQVFCLPVLLLLPEKGGAGVAATALQPPADAPLATGRPISFTAHILAESATARYIELLFQVTMKSKVVFSETVVIPKLLAAGDMVSVATAKSWSPAMIGTAVLTVTVDPNQRIIEENESNNTLTQAYLLVQTTTPGDCNGDGRITAGDLSALAFEIFDLDGNFWLNAPQGAFPGTPYCDSNKDTRIDAGDLSCTARRIFYPERTCY
ncbi:MAG: hypothetical protein DYG89_29455 [Caldilinea sp. CFX5]|nr:hypothetical protein [Caldilinea sp. CFX5]